MRDSPHKANSNIDSVISRPNDLPSAYFDEYKSEFKYLMIKYKSLLGQ